MSTLARRLRLLLAASSSTSRFTQSTPIALSISFQSIQGHSSHNCKTPVCCHCSSSWHSSLQSRGMACSAGLGRAPPKRISVEFDPDDVENFIKLADAIEAAFPSVVVEGNESGDGRRGSFEIQTEEGVSIWSRLSPASQSSGASGAESSLPDTQLIIDRITNRANLGRTSDEANKPFCG